jgi:hypothetical protein
MQKNYGFVWTMPLVALILGTLILIPILIGGFAVVFKVIKIIYSPVGEGSIPIWMIFVGGILSIWLYSKISKTRADIRKQERGY